MWSKRKAIAELFKSTTVNLLIHYRVCNYLCSKKTNILQKIIHGVFYIRFKKLQNKCGIEMNQHMKIGEGLRLPHKQGIVLHPLSIIGNNCEIMNDVTIGNNIMKSRSDVPKIGDNVLVCVGSRIIGGVVVGNNVVIGANSVVNKDIPDGKCVAGVPAKIIKETSDAYMINVAYDAITN